MKNEGTPQERQYAPNAKVWLSTAGMAIGVAAAVFAPTNARADEAPATQGVEQSTEITDAPIAEPVASELTSEGAAHVSTEDRSTHGSSNGSGDRSKEPEDHRPAAEPSNRQDTFKAFDLPGPAIPPTPVTPTVSKETTNAPSTSAGQDNREHNAVQEAPQPTPPSPTDTDPNAPTSETERAAANNPPQNKDENAVTEKTQDQKDTNPQFSAFDLPAPNVPAQTPAPKPETPPQAPAPAPVAPAPAPAPALPPVYVPPAKPEREMVGRVEYFSQHDEPWAGVRYDGGSGKGNIDRNGCGPSTLAMIVSTLTNRDVTPIDMANELMALGDKGVTESGSTVHDGAAIVGRKFGLRVEYIGDDDVAAFDRVTAAGGIVWTNGRDAIPETPATTGGHIIGIHDVDDAGNIFVADPNSREKSRQPFRPDQITGERNWIAIAFYPGESAPLPPPPPPAPAPAPVAPAPVPAPAPEAPPNNAEDTPDPKFNAFDLPAPKLASSAKIGNFAVFDLPSPVRPAPQAPPTPAAPAPAPETPPAPAPVPRGFNTIPDPEAVHDDVYNSHLQYLSNIQIEMLPKHQPALDKFVRHYQENKARYTAIAERTNLPAPLIAALHWRESGGSFDRYMHNGEPLGRPTTLVPAGKLFHNFEDSAVDALGDKRNLQTKYSLTRDSQDLAGMASYAEYYNGLGYFKKGRPSPYVYSGTSVYKSGKYVADGVYDPSVQDVQIGVVLMINAVRDL